MADHQKVKIYLIRTKVGTQGLSRSLITNLHLKFTNLKWRIQYGGSIYKNLLHSNKNWYSRVFEVADHESLLKILEFKIMNQNLKISLIRMKIFTQHRILCRNISEIFSTFHCNCNIVSTFLSNIANYFIATLQFQLSEIFLKTNIYLIVLEIL